MGTEPALLLCAAKPDGDRTINKNRLKHCADIRLDKEKLTQQGKGKLEAYQFDSIGKEG